MICDFCSADNPRFCYTAVPIATLAPNLSIGFGYDERWAACPTCAAIIDRKDKEGLIKRSIETFVLPAMIPDHESKKYITFAELNLRNLYDAFFGNVVAMRKMCLEEAERPARAPVFGTITIEKEKLK